MNFYLHVKSPQTLRCSFSAVSTPIFASKDSSESSWRDLQDSHTFAPLRLQNFSQKSSNFFRKWIVKFSFFSIFWLNFAILKPNFDEILSEFRQIFQKMIKSVERVMRSCKKLTNFPENYSTISGIPENIEFFDWIFHQFRKFHRFFGKILQNFWKFHWI